MFHSIHTKTVVAFVAVLFVTASIVLVTSYAHIQQHEHELMESMGLAAAQECANAIEIAYDQGSGGEFVPGTSDYDSCLEYLRNLCLVTGMNYLYVCKYDIENDTITYIMAVGASDDENEAITRDRPYGTVIHDGIDDVEMRALAGEEVKEALETDNQFGHMLDWVSPVREMGNDVLAGASYSMTEQRQREMVNAWSNLLPFVIAFLLLFVVEILIIFVLILFLFLFFVFKLVACSLEKNCYSFLLFVIKSVKDFINYIFIAVAKLIIINQSSDGFCLFVGKGIKYGLNVEFFIHFFISHIVIVLLVFSFFLHIRM